MAQIDIALNQPKGNTDTPFQRFKIEKALFCPLRRRISIDDDEHLLEPRVSKLLSVLIAADQPLSRESLLDEIWGKDGSDEALTQAVSKLRRALGDTHRPYKIIGTLPKQGYQLKVQAEPDFSNVTGGSEVRTVRSFRGLLANMPVPSNFYHGVMIGAGAVLISMAAISGLFGPRASEVEIECPINASGEECLAIVQAAVARE